MATLLWLTTLALLTGCSTQNPGTSHETPKVPERLQMAADYSAAHAGDALVVWKRETWC